VITWRYLRHDRRLTRDAQWAAPSTASWLSRTSSTSTRSRQPRAVTANGATKLAAAATALSAGPSPGPAPGAESRSPFAAGGAPAPGPISSRRRSLDARRRDDPAGREHGRPV